MAGATEEKVEKVEFYILIVKFHYNKKCLRVAKLSFLAITKNVSLSLMF